MAISDQLKNLVAQMPDPDGRKMYCENIDKEKIERTTAEIHKGGRDNVAGLIEMLGEPGTEENVKPHYALHCVANHVLIIDDENARRQFCEVLVAKLDSDLSDFNKGYLCQELRWAGGKEAVAALGKLLLDEALVEPASAALTAIGDGAAEQFRAALPGAKGKCRLSIVQGLGAVADAKSVDALQKALGDDDSEVRLAAGWGLSKIADAGSADALIKAADVDPGWERIQATKHCLVMAENLTAAGKQDVARKIYLNLVGTRKDSSEAYVRLAAAKAMSAL
ncbi:MAG: HEAT repeat domain-containing protein [Thermoguttaceae bacterium]